VQGGGRGGASPFVSKQTKNGVGKEIERDRSTKRGKTRKPRKKRWPRAGGSISPILKKGATKRGGKSVKEKKLCYTIYLTDCPASRKEGPFDPLGAF